MSAEIVVFLAVRECRGENTAFCGSQMPVMKETFLSERSRLPAHHAGGCNRNPVNAAGFIREISAYLLEALAAKQLALTGTVQLPFKAVRFRIVASLFLENCPRDSQPEIFLDRKSTRLNSSHIPLSRMPSS